MICCEAGEIRVPLATTLFIAWVAVFFCIHKCIKSSGKVKKMHSLTKFISDSLARIKDFFSLCCYKNH